MIFSDRLQGAALCFDTSLQGLSCGVLLPEEGRYYKVIKPLVRGQAETLVPTINRLLEFSGLRYKDLSLVLTTVGPGAFAGLRIGLSLARSFRITLSCPVQGISSFSAPARQAAYLLQKHFPDVGGKAGFVQKMWQEREVSTDLSEQQGEEPGEVGDISSSVPECTQSEFSEIRVVLETKRKDFYMQKFTLKGEAIDPPVLAGIDEVCQQSESSACFAGDGVDRLISIRPDIAPFCIQGTELSDPKSMLEAYLCQPPSSGESLAPLYLKGADVSISQKKFRTLGIKDKNIF